MISRQGQLSILFLKSADLALLLAALGLTIAVIYAPEAEMSMPDYSVDFLSTRIKLSNALLCGLLLLVWHFCFKVNGLYLSYRLSEAREIVWRVFKVVGFCAIALFIVAQIAGWKTLRIGPTSVFFAFGCLFIGGYRLLIFYLSRRFRRRGINIKTLLVLGGGFRSEKFIKTIKSNRELGYRVLGYLDSDPLFGRRKLAGSRWLGGFEELPKIIDKEVVDEVAIALPIKSHYTQIKTAVAQLEEQGVVVHILSDFFPHHLARIQPQEFQGFPLLSLHNAPVFHWQTEIKRLVDTLGALILLIIFTPLFIPIAILIKLDSRGPVLFTQERVGLSKRRFRLIKFRTMIDNAESKLDEVVHLDTTDGPFKLPNDPRITRLGKYLRKFSLDELPQLFNVLLGDMSLVGPRPLAVRDALMVEESWQKRRFSIRPGMTCLWQVSGRSDLSFEEWMELDLEYIDSWSLYLDWWILMRTIPAVLTARGAV